MKAHSSTKHRIHAVRLIHLKRELYKRLQTFPTVFHQASVFISQVCSSGKCVHLRSEYIGQLKELHVQFEDSAITKQEYGRIAQ